MRRRLHHGTVRTDVFARGLLSRPAEYIRMVGIGRLWIVWDTNVRATAPAPDLTPRSTEPLFDEHSELNVPRGYRMAPTESEPDRIVRIALDHPIRTEGASS